MAFGEQPDQQASHQTFLADDDFRDFCFQRLDPASGCLDLFGDFLGG
jgi:hypothetical protein